MSVAPTGKWHGRNAVDVKKGAVLIEQSNGVTNGGGQEITVAVKKLL